MAVRLVLTDMDRLVAFRIKGGEGDWPWPRNTGEVVFTIPLEDVDAVSAASERREGRKGLPVRFVRIELTLKNAEDALVKYLAGSVLTLVCPFEQAPRGRALAAAIENRLATPG
jgi:hypothetical protein